MPSFEIVIAHLPAHVTDRDAEALGLRVLCDGSYLQYVEVLVSGQDAVLAHADVYAESKFWPALAVSVCPLIEHLCDEGRLPTTTPDRAYPITAIAFEEVRRRAQAGAVPELEVGSVIWSFER